VSKKKKKKDKNFRVLELLGRYVELFINNSTIIKNIILGYYE